MSVNNTQRALLANYLLGQGSSSTQGKNYVKNSIGINGTQSTTVGGTATVSKNTTTPLTGISDFGITLDNNTTDYVEWSLDTLDNSLNNGNCQLTFDYKITSIGSAVQGQVYIGGTLVNSQTIPSSPSISSFSLNVPCGDLSASTTVRISNSTGNTGTSSLNVANINYGKATNIGTVSQPLLIGSVVITGCSGSWNATSTTYTSFAVQTGCVYTTTGTALAPSTMIPGIRFASLPPGDYRLEYEGSAASQGSNVAAFFQFSDGTNTARETSAVQGTSSLTTIVPGLSQTISYTAPQSNITLQIRSKVDSGATSRIYGTTAVPGTIKVWYFPNSAQQVFNTAQLPASWSGYHGTDCSWNRGSTTYASYAEDNSCSFTERTNRNFGSVTSPIVTTGRIPRITFTPNKPGMYQVCASFAASSATVSNATGYKMVDASSNELATKINYTAVAGNPNILQMCAIVNATNTSAYTVNIQGQAAGVATNYINQNNNNTVDWTIISLDNQFPAPVLVGSVTSNANSALRVVLFSATVSGAGVCTINSNPYADISTCTESGQAGVATFSKVFSAAPICFSNKTLSTSAYFTGINGSTTSTVTFASWQTTSATVYSSNPVNVMCIGPR